MRKIKIKINLFILNNQDIINFTLKALYQKNIINILVIFIIVVVFDYFIMKINMKK